jgi:hypothetical protein
MATLAELENALRNADAAGDAEGARILANEIIRRRQQAAAPSATATPMPMGGSAAPVLTTPANAAPARGLASRPVDIAAERREAQAAISRGAPAADVRKRFKERTGQDL